MQNIFDFLVESGKLKEMPRRGWVINQIKNPESIAEHIFRATLMAWILGEKKKGLDIEYIIKSALAHDLCEVYAGDTTPYDSVLPESKEELQKLMKTWPRFSKEEKEKNALEKHTKEKESLEKLVFYLPEELKKEIKNLWMDYEKKRNKEGMFFNQADRMENFLQAYEYWEQYKRPPLAPWWIWAREFFDDPLLLDCMDILEYRFHKGRIPEKLEPSLKLVNFFSQVGKLKRKPRRGWVIKEIEKAETTGDHIYHLALLVWILGRKKEDLNLEKALKIALIHDIPEIYAPDFTSYDAVGLDEQEEVTEKDIENLTPREGSPTKKQREKMVKIKREAEKKAIEKILFDLDENLKEEIRRLFTEYEKGVTPEGIFVEQANTVINIFQGMEYYKKYGKSIEQELWIKRGKEIVDDPDLLELIGVIEKKVKEYQEND